MKNFYFKKFFHLKILLTAIILLFSYNIFGQEKVDTLPKENFYNKSLHFTNNGMKYWYLKEQGGVELLTGKTAEEMNCTSSECHAYSCDVCHLKVSNRISNYSLEPSGNNDICKRCHNKDEDGPDVHFQKGMKCMDCHTAKEIHGDGVSHNTYYEYGFFDVRCEKCHSNLSSSNSHIVHNAKLGCSACHTDEYKTCINCHLEKNKGIPAFKNMFFLINKDGKVILANIKTFVSQNKTMITVAPEYSHSIKKEGRKCRECHAAENLKNISTNNFIPFYFENGEVKNINGVIPVYDVANWKINYFNYENEKWMTIKNPERSLINYVGYCTPLTKEQFDKLLKVQKSN